MTAFEWARPPALVELASAFAVPAVDRAAWADLVARATTAETLSRVQRELAEAESAEGAAASPDETHWLTDFVGSWFALGAENPEATEAAAGLVAQFGLLSEDQLQSLSEAVETTAEELRTQELVAAGEADSAEENVGEAAEETSESAERQFVRGIGSEVARRSGVSGVPLDLPGNLPVDLGVDLGLTQKATELAGSLVPLGGLNQMLPEAAVISLAASAGMRIRNGESVDDVKKWLVGELSTIGVANAASVALQVLSGLVVLRPLAVLGAKWGKARAESSAQATVAIRAARERLAVLLGS